MQMKTLIAYTKNVGRLAASAGKTIVSGGARGIDQAAMLGALEQGGKVIGVLADSLEKSAMNRENRNALINGQLVLISSYDPSAGFQRRQRHAAQQADLRLGRRLTGGEFRFQQRRHVGWGDRTADKLRMVPVFVRSTGETSEGLQALRKRAHFRGQTLKTPTNSRTCSTQPRQPPCKPTFPIFDRSAGRIGFRGTVGN